MLLDQGKKSLISLSHRNGVAWTEDSVEGLHLYCNPSKANVVLGEINNIKKKATTPVPDKPYIKPTSPTDKSSTKFGMALAQTAMPANGESVLVEQRIDMVPESEGYVITSPGGTASALPPPLPPVDDVQNLSQCMVTRLRTVDRDTVDKLSNQYPHQTIGNMEIKIKDELLQYLSKFKAAALKRIENKSNVNIAKHPGKVIISVKEGSEGRSNEGISLAYSDFLQLYNETQSKVKFVNLDMRPLNMDEATLSEALKKINNSCPNVMIFNKFKESGSLTLVGPEDELKNGFLHLPSTGKVITQSPGKQGETPSDFKKEIKGKDGYSYFGDLSKMNAKKVYTYRDTGSGIVLMVKNGSIAEEETECVVQYCDTRGKVLALATGSGRAKIPEQELGSVVVNITNQTAKNAQVMYACVSDGALSKQNVEMGLKNAFRSSSQNRYRNMALPPLSTGTVNELLYF